MFIVTGATGHVGSAVAETLLSAGKNVRVIVRNAAKAERLKSLGAEVFVADLTDQAALGRAMRDGDGVFLLSPPDAVAKDFIHEREALTQRQVETLVRAKVPHAVFLSSVGAQHAAGTGPVLTAHHFEEQLRASGLPSTFVRAGYFLENWAAVADVVRNQGVLPSFMGKDQHVPTVSTADIGKTVAQALLDGPRGVRIIELAGPRDVTPTDVARIFSDVLAKPVNVVEAPLDAVVPTFKSFGISDNVAGLYREMYAAIKEGKLAPERGNEQQRGTTPVEQTLRALIA